MGFDDLAVRAPATAPLHVAISARDRPWMKRYRIPLLSALLVFLAYLPLAFFRFAFADDYAYMMIHGFRAVNPFLIGDGRVLGGLISAGLFSLFDRVSEASALRLIGLSELIVCVLMVQYALMLIGFEVGWAAFAAVLWASSPTIQNWVVWGVSSWQLPALILGLAAFYPWRKIVEPCGRPSPGNIVVFIALQFLAMLIYQPFAVAVWPLVALSLLTTVGQRHWMRRLLFTLGALAVVLLVSFAATELIIWLAIPNGGHDRVEVASLSDIPRKLAWLVSQMSFVCSFVGTEPSRIIYLPALLTIALGLALKARGLNKFILILGLFLGATVMAALPSLVCAEDTPIRTDVVLALLACVFLTFALREIVGLDARVYRYAGALLAVVALLALLRSAYDVVRYNAEPQERELAAIQRQLTRLPFPPSRPVVLIGPSENVFLSDQRYCGVVYIGCASSSMRFALPNMVRLWLRDNKLDLKANALFFARSRDDREVFSFEPDRSAWAPMPSDPFFFDVQQALGK